MDTLELDFDMLDAELEVERFIADMELELEVKRLTRDLV